MRFFILFCLASLVLISSCVTNKKYLYLQKNDLNKKQHLDSAMRNYTLEKFDYKLQTNDIVSIRYQSIGDKNFDFLNPQNAGMPVNALGVGGALLFGDLIDERGEIPMSVVGKVKVAGLTIFQAQDTLQKIANRYMDASTVKVRLLNYRVTFLGQVAKEGSIILNNNRVSLIEALGLAGGLGELADRSNIKIIRQIGSTAEVQYVNLLSEDFLTSPYFYVHQNDVIIVPPLKQRPFKLYFTQNLSVLLSAFSVALLIITLNKK